MVVFRGRQVRAHIRGQREFRQLRAEVFQARQREGPLLDATEMPVELAAGVGLNSRRECGAVAGRQQTGAELAAGIGRFCDPAAWRGRPDIVYS